MQLATWTANYRQIERSILIPKDWHNGTAGGIDIEHIELS
jgi:hypothetical protein